MNLDTAKSAATLAAQIDGFSAVIAKLQTAISEGWSIAGVTALDKSAAPQALVFATLDSELSGKFLSFVQSTYQAQLDKLNSSLTALA